MATKKVTAAVVEENEGIVKRGSINEEHVVKLIDEWQDHTIAEFAQIFGTKESTVSGLAALLRKESGGKACPLKKKKKIDLYRKVLKDKNLI